MTGTDTAACQETSLLEYQLDRVDQQTKLEAELINYRVQWLLLTQSFIFAGYFLKLPNGSPLEANLPRILFLIGIVSSVSIAASLFIAFVIAAKRRIARHSIEIALRNVGYNYLSVAKPNSVANILGAMPPLTISVLIFVSWLFIGFAS